MGENCSILQYLTPSTYQTESYTVPNQTLVKARNVVMQKLMTSSGLKSLPEQDLLLLAEILSDKNKLLCSYLHTDFEAVKNLQQQIDRIQLLEANVDSSIELQHSNSIKVVNDDVVTTSINQTNNIRSNTPVKEIITTGSDKSMKDNKEQDFKEKPSVDLQSLYLMSTSDPVKDTSDLKRILIENKMASFGRDKYSVGGTKVHPLYLPDLEKQTEQQQQPTAVTKNIIDSSKEQDSSTVIGEPSINTGSNLQQTVREDPFDGFIPSNNNKESLRIKFIISEISNNPFEKELKRIISPITNRLNDSSEFGFFHVALGIGPWKIEFNNNSLCIPRTLSGSAAMICADLETIATIDELDYVRDRLADVIVKWNTSMHYCKKAVENGGNCQNFIDDVLHHLGLAYKLQQVPPCLRTYLIRLRQGGYGEMEMEPDYDFAKTFKIQFKRYVFRSHQELDEFVNHLTAVEPDFQWRYKYEYYMLKAFDRAFWLKHLAMPQIKNYQPLLLLESSTSTTDVDNKEATNNVKKSINLNHCCAFGDPRRISMIDFKVKLHNH